MQQKEKDYYLKLVGYTILGLAIVGLIAGAGYLIWTSLTPHSEAIGQFFLTFVLPVIFAIIIMIIILIILYAALFLGVAVTYLNKPMKVSKKDKKYSIKKTKEAGKRQSGSSGKR